MSGTYPRKDETNLRKLVQSIQDLFAGRNNCSGSFSLAAAPATQTVVGAPNCASGATPLWTPTNANAAAEIGAGTMYLASVGQGEFTVMHSASADARTFRYTAVG